MLPDLESVIAFRTLRVRAAGFSRKVKTDQTAGLTSADQRSIHVIQIQTTELVLFDIETANNSRKCSARRQVAIMLPDWLDCHCWFGLNSAFLLRLNQVIVRSTQRQINFI